VRLFVADLRKLIRRPATWIIGLILAAIVALFYLAIGASAGQATTDEQRAQLTALLSFPAAYYIVLSFILGLGGLLAVVYGSAVSGAEWAWGTLKVAVARGESRGRYMLAAFAALALIVLFGLLLAFAVGLGMAAVGASIAGVGTAGIDDPETVRRLPELLGRAWLGMLEQAALGFAIGTVARSQLAGIGAGIALYFVETFAAIAFPNEVRYLPFSVAGSLVSPPEGAFGGGGGGGGGGPQLTPLDPTLVVALVVAYLVAALVVTVVATERAEITG
jgi:ABC-type transport system involved in multi-copper enzyme maturation permease subunit